MAVSPGGDKRRTRRRAALRLLLSAGSALFEDSLSHSEGFEGGGRSAVRGRLQEDFLDFFYGAAIAHRATDVHGKLMHPVLGSQNRQVNQAARLPVQARTTPYPAPANLSHVLLNRAREIGRC